MPATKNDNAIGNSQVRRRFSRPAAACLSRSPVAIRFFLALALVFVAGCTPPGPRALLRGIKALNRGDYPAAVEQFQTAVKILPANAQAWNYLGVAEQHAGQFNDAVLAYQRALALNRDLVEAHYNLGCLYLEQNKIPDAKTEFTAYTLHRGNAPEGWVKLGSAQLRGGEIVSAEKSFSIALGLNTNNAAALNGLGLARIQRGRPRDAALFFAAAVQNHPDFAPAILNLATVNAQYLNDDRAALENYQRYLALTPRPADWQQVKAVADKLQESLGASAVAATPPSRPPAVETAHPVPVARTPSPVAHAAPPRNPPPSPHPSNQFSSSSPVASEKPTVAQRLAARPQPPLRAYNSSGEAIENPPDVVEVPSAPVKKTPPPVFPRYHYLSPRKPAPGNREAATASFARARQYEMGARWSEAADAYAQATKQDPSWFDAQYNLGVIAYRARRISESLAAYESALAINPDSSDARYNFALVLKAAGYPVDAVNELKRIVAANPNDVRAHLALGNLYAQQLQDKAQAREHYLKVMQIDPHNPQATDIGFWLANNPD
ncbi:MAG TPA: tetratricopeptide repeat protein [Verrucomicrobiae bacterium]|nr:tetratricopeptide repeat protein [Verrucomicrobiae bacterium]